MTARKIVSFLLSNYKEKNILDCIHIRVGMQNSWDGNSIKSIHLVVQLFQSL